MPITTKLTHIHNFSTYTDDPSKAEITILEDMLSLIRCGNKEIYLLGTVHGSNESVAQVRHVIEKGKKTSDDLNARFANWYYVISSGNFDKLHLKRSDLVQEKKKDS